MAVGSLASRSGAVAVARGTMDLLGMIIDSRLEQANNFRDIFLEQHDDFVKANTEAATQMVGGFGGLSSCCCETEIGGTRHAWSCKLWFTLLCSGLRVEQN